MKKQSLRVSMIATPLIVVCGLLALDASARAQSTDGPCSKRTFSGDYGFSVEGLILPAPGVALPFRGVHLTHFDGRGNLTQVDSLLANGNPVSDWNPVVGTHQVNANYTGTILLDPSTGGFLNLRIVVVKQSKETHTVVWPPFDGPARTVTSVGTRVE